MVTLATAGETIEALRLVLGECSLADGLLAVTNRLRAEGETLQEEAEDEDDDERRWALCRAGRSLDAAALLVNVAVRDLEESRG